MKGMKKKVLVLTVCLALLTGLSVGVALAQEKITLRFATWHFLEPGKGELHQSIIERFEKENPGIHVETEGITTREFSDKMLVQMAAGNAPDIVCMYCLDKDLWLSQGYIAKLTDYIDFSKYEGKFNATATDGIWGKGEGYLLTIDTVNYAGLIYNKEIFKKAGVTVPANPDEFFAIAEKLTNPPKQYALSHPLRPSNTMYFMQGSGIILEGYGGRIAVKGKITVDESAFKDGVRMVKRLYDTDIVPKAMDFSTQRKMLFAGNIAMEMDGMFIFGWTRAQYPDIYPKLAAAPLPWPCKWNMLETVDTVITSDSKHKPEAAKLLEFYLRPDIQAEYFKVYGDMTILKETFTPEVLKLEPWWKPYLEALPFGRPMTIEGLEVHTWEIKKIVADYMGEVLAGTRTVDEAMAECQKELDALVKRKRG